MPDQDPAPLTDATGSAASLLASIPKPGEAPAADGDTAPAKPARKSRSGTSGAERARRARAGREPAKDKPPATPKLTTLERQLRDRFAAVAELLSMVQPADAAVLKHNGPKLAHLFATKYPRIGAQLARLLGIANELDGLALLGLVVGLIADNHGLLPEKASAGVKLGAMLTGIAPPAKLVGDMSAGAGELGALVGLLTSNAADVPDDASGLATVTPITPTAEEPAPAPA